MVNVYTSTEYCDMAEARVKGDAPMFVDVQRG